MASPNGSDQHVSGIVRSVNDKGLKLEGYDSWFNISRFAVAVALPERGQSVTCTLDKAGFLRAVAPASGAIPTIAGASDHAPAASAAPSTRDRTITRLAVLKAAAEFGAARPNLKSGDVLAIAATWERWVNRDEETTYDLTDAFSGVRLPGRHAQDYENHSLERTMQDFRRTYGINAEGGLYAVDSWTTDGGQRVESRTTELTEEEYEHDRDAIEAAYLEDECERAERERQRMRRRRQGA